MSSSWIVRRARSRAGGFRPASRDGLWRDPVEALAGAGRATTFTGVRRTVCFGAAAAFGFRATACGRRSAPFVAFLAAGFRAAVRFGATLRAADLVVLRAGRLALAAALRGALDAFR